MTVYIHIGATKTASTFLQYEVFPKLEGVRYERKITLAQAVMLSVNPRKGKVLISDERLSGADAQCEPFEQRGEQIHYLKLLFPEAKIILVTREKESWLKSAHNYIYRLRGYKKDFKTFKKELDGRWSDWKSLEGLIRMYFDDVFVLKYEELCESPHAFVNSICKFIGVDMIHFDNKKYNVSKPL